MLAARTSGGRTRTCPHCKATILASAAICPQCKHHLRFEAAVPIEEERSGFSALNVEGSIQHPPQGAVWEYSLVLTIKDERGTEISRQVVGVGALRGKESRTFNLSVEVLTSEPGKD